MKSMKFKLIGTTPLMMNNPQTVNPLSYYSKELKKLTSKRTKQDEDMEEIFHIKFLSSLYMNNRGQYIVPLDMIEQTLIAAAKENKLGKKFERSVVVPQDAILEFKHKNCTPEELYQNFAELYVDIRPVGVMKAKIPTARAIFPEWSLETEIFFDETQLNDSDIAYALDVAGQRYGIGTYRKKFGKFRIEEIKSKKRNNQ